MNIAATARLQPWLSKVQIRHARAGDLSALEWEGAYAHFRRVYARAFQRTQRGHAVLWVAETPDLLIGQVFVMLKSDFDPELADGKQRAFIHSFRVRPEFRCAGLGSRLLDTTEGDLISRGFTTASLNVAHDNPAALRLYERKGYQRIRPVSGDWSYIDHLGVERQVHEPGWRMSKNL
ncbi:MAG: N-acetyltransferase [Anaerolineales bacterium]